MFLTVRWIVFDAAGTLLALRGSVGEIYAEIAREVGGELDAAAVERGFTSAMREAPPLAFGETRGDEALSAAERDWWRLVAWRAIGGAAGPELDFERFFDRAWRRFAEPSPWQVFEDVRPALRALRAAGVPLAVFSNWDRRLRDVLAGLGLGGFFARIIVSSELSAAKPDPQAFIAARHALEAGASVGQARPVMVGDRIDFDIEPARTAGWDAVWLDRAGEAKPVPAGVARIGALTQLSASLAESNVA